MMPFVVTPAAGKRLIAKAVAQHAAVQHALQSGTVVIVAGTTNGYVAEEILDLVGQRDGFSKEHFIRGVTLPPGRKLTEMGRLPDESEFPGDVVLVRGRRQRGKTIFDVAEDLQEEDVVLKGANAVNPLTRQAAVLIGHPKGGTLAAVMQAVVGRRVRLLIPVGLEKRVYGDLQSLAVERNAPGRPGPRLWPVPGEVITELDAVKLLTGVDAELFAAGGVGGAEGAVWLDISGAAAQLEAARTLMESVSQEPNFAL
jgi:hypothetical protein